MGGDWKKIREKKKINRGTEFYNIDSDNNKRGREYV